MARRYSHPFAPTWPTVDDMITNEPQTCDVCREAIPDGRATLHRGILTGPCCPAEAPHPSDPPPVPRARCETPRHYFPRGAARPCACGRFRSALVREPFEPGEDDHRSAR